jgi:hypothetical protein
MIKNLSVADCFVVSGGEINSTCTWKKSSNTGAYVISAVSGFISGAATFATFYSAGGGNLKELIYDKDKRAVLYGGVGFSLFSCSLTTLGTYFASSDCYNCEPNI